MAERMVRFRLAWFSIWVARLARTSSRFPPTSPAWTSVQNSSENTLGCFAHAVDSAEPFSTSRRTANKTRANSLFSTWPARIPSERTTDNPESTMVDSCRVTTATSFNLTRSEIPGILISVFMLMFDFGVTAMGI